jgi:hypothetical protein
VELGGVIIVSVKSRHFFIFLIGFAYLVACRNSQDVLTDVAKSHVEANAPRGELFDEFLARDLKKYFCASVNDCAVQYEFLRNGPTQSGTSYPKYYLWVKNIKGSTVAEEGAVRVAAVEQKGFEVTRFLSREQILESPSQVASVFPPALIDKIFEKARSK